MTAFLHNLTSDLYKFKWPRGGYRISTVLSAFLEGSFVQSAYGPELYHFGQDYTLYSCLSGKYGHVVSDQINALNPGDAFIDVGANMGLFSILAAQRVGAAGKVVSFEPQKKRARRRAVTLAFLGAFLTIALTAFWIL